MLRFDPEGLPYSEEENLVAFLPEKQRKFAFTPTFNALLKALLDLFNASREDKDEYKQALKHAKTNFDHYCNSQLSQPQNVNEREKTRIKKDLDKSFEDYKKSLMQGLCQ